MGTFMREIGRISLLLTVLIFAFGGSASAQDQFNIVYYTDGIAIGNSESRLFQVELDTGSGIAQLTELVVLGPGATGAGDPGWENVDVLAVTPDGRKLYFIDDGRFSDPNGRMGVYDVDTGHATEIGQVTFEDKGTVPLGKNWIDQAAFSPDGTLYITNVVNDRLYSVDLSTAYATLVGAVVEMHTRTVIDLKGADIAFGADGSLMLWTSFAVPFAPRGLYRVASVPTSGDVPAEYLGGGLTARTGMGVVLNGMGDLVLTNRSLNRFELMDRSNGFNVLGYFDPFLGGALFRLTNGDIASALNFSEGRMTGGGVVKLEDKSKVRHGFRLECDTSERPNRLQVTWGKGNKFHLTKLTDAFCYDDPTITARPPRAGFDTYTGRGTGRLNGVKGATAEWEISDGGQPGRRDVLTITITDRDGNVVLSATGSLKRGNHQAH
jgi:hypothetical protein